MPLRPVSLTNRVLAEHKNLVPVDPLCYCFAPEKISRMLLVLGA